MNTCKHCVIRTEIDGRTVVVHFLWDHLEKVAASSERGCILYRCPVCGTFWESCAYEPSPREVDVDFVSQHYPIDLADAFELSEGTMTTVESLVRFFHRHDPGLELIGYEDHTALFQLHDLDEYRIGRLSFLDVSLLCAGTQWESYDDIRIYRESDLPAEFLYLRDNLPRDYILVVLQSARDEGDSALPLIGGSRRGFIICREVTFEAETNPGR